MGFLMLLVFITSLVSFVGFVWLTRDAFRFSTGWGLAVLLLSPFSAVVFAVKNWEESKKPFLICFGSAATGVVLMIGGVLVLGGLQAAAMANDIQSGVVTDEQAAGFINGQMDRMEASGMLDADGQADLEQMRGMMGQMTGVSTDGENSDNAQAATSPRISEPDETSSAAVIEALRTRAQETASDSRHSPVGPISIRDADRHIGRAMTAVGTDGIEHTGRLASTDSTSLWLEKNFSGGTFAVELKKVQVRSLEIVD